MRTGQTTLDDPSALKVADPGGMLALVGALGSQLREGFDLGRAAAGLPTTQGLRSVVACGMGGSGIAGDVLRASLGERLSVPVVTVKGYRLPSYCTEETLVMAISYSGDTEETVSAYAQAVAAGCRVVVVSSGGELAGLAKTDGVPHVTVPGDVPAPRAALGYLAGAAIGILEAIGLTADAGADVGRASEAVEALADELGPDRQAGVNQAKSLALWLLGRIPLVWGSEGEAEAAALRWKTQFNENAKLPAFSAALPELDHNDVEGWTGEMGRPFGLIILRHGREHPRIAPRVDATMQAVAGSGLESREVMAQGSTAMEVLFSLAMLGDFVSTYLAVLRGVDPMPVRVLTGLKERLRS